MKNSYIQAKETVERKWYVVDADGQSLGRVAAKVATVLRGKHKPTYTPNVDCGDFVIVINASKVNLTGNKLADKKYYNHSRYAGGMRVRTAKEMIEKYPEEMMEVAIKGMLPKRKIRKTNVQKVICVCWRISSTCSSTTS